MDDPAKSIVFFDGDCLFCQTQVRWLLRHDRDQCLQVASLQGQTAAQLIPESLRRNLTTLVLLERDPGNHFCLWTKSNAVCRIAARLPTPWRLGALLTLIPAGLRDLAYDSIAIRRHKLVKSACSMEHGIPQARMRDILP